MKAWLAAGIALFLVSTGVGCGGDPGPGPNTPPPAGGQDGRVDMAEARLSIRVPAGWRTKREGGVVTVGDPNDEIAAAFVVVDEAVLDQVSHALGVHLGKTVQNIKIGKSEVVTINGMKGSAVDGDGRMNGVDIDFMVLFLDTPAPGKAIMMFAIAEDANLAKHKSEVKYLVSNLQPT